MSTTPHIVVVGLGIVGSSIAATLAENRLRVTALEQFGPLHERGSSHGDTRIYRRIPHEGSVYADLAAASFVGWRRWSALAGERLFVECGGIDAGPAASPMVQASAQLCAAHRVSYELLSGRQARERFPLYRLPNEWEAVYQPQSGYVRADATRAFLHRWARSAGANLLFDTAAQRIEPSRAGIRVDTARESILADVVVVAAGSWLGALAPGLPIALGIERRVTAWYRPAAPDGLAHEAFPIFCLDADGGWYGMPTPDGDVKIGHDKHFSERIDPDAGPAVPSESDAGRLAGCLQTYFAGFPSAPHRMKACIYSITPDHHFVIDRHPDEERILLFSCCSGHGFKYAPVYGGIAADLIGSKERSDLAQFRLSRTAPAVTRFAD